MSNTIREQIILAVIARLADVRTTKGYNTNIGQYVNRALKNPNWDNLPFVTVIPQAETVRQEYNVCKCAMEIGLTAVAAHGTTNPSVIAEQLLGDMVECMTGIRWTLAFTSGGTVVPVIGQTLTGATSAATAYIEAITVTSGSWAGGNAAGTFALRRYTGTFQAENLNIGASANVCTIAGAPTGSRATVSVTSSLADRVLYTAGGATQYPDADDTVTGCSATFQIDYQIVSGDPYHQP